jgi:hypothetical protein
MCCGHLSSLISALKRAPALGCAFRLGVQAHQIALALRNISRKQFAIRAC